ncbi:MAG: STAS domain-containing protein [Pseudomonadota bacterium]
MRASSELFESTPTGARLLVDIDWDNANVVRAAGEALIRAADTTARFDLSSLDATSPAVAVAIDWLRAARDAQVDLGFDGLSPELQGVLEFSGLSQLFACDAAASD